MVLRGCPRKLLFLHWFYKVVREKCCFYIGFTKVVREKREETCVKTRFFVDNPPGMVWAPEEQKQLNWPHNSPSYTIESPLARPHSFASPRPLARTNETKRFPGWLTPPTSNTIPATPKVETQKSSPTRAKKLFRHVEDESAAPRGSS